MATVIATTPGTAGRLPALRPQLVVGLAAGREELRACQALRHRVFAEELGARLHDDAGGLDQDHFDAYCKHLLVQDEATGEVVGTSRVLLERDAEYCGGFYSETEFDIDPVRALPGRLMELGRTCIHPDYRTGAAITVLWSGLARLMVMHRIDYLFGCASLPMSDGGALARSLTRRLPQTSIAPAALQVQPRRPVPGPVPGDALAVDRSQPLPTLLRAYLRAGALVCGEPCWDPDFDVADAFVLLARDKLESRYARHFLDRS